MEIGTLESGDRTAVVLSGDVSPGAYDMLRALAFVGVNAMVASSHPDNIAFSSRHCGGKIIIPHFEVQNYDRITSILISEARKAKEKPVLLYTSDPDLLYVWRDRDKLSKHYRFLLPEDHLLEQVFNKARFSELAQTYNLPVPKTHLISKASDLDMIIDDIDLPCIVKPAYSVDWKWETEAQARKFGWYKKALRRFESKESLLEFCQALPDRASGFLIQSYIDGRDETIVSFHGYFDENSRCLGFFLGRKIRTYPPHTGGSAYVQTIHDEQLAHLSVEYMQRLRFKGIVKIDYKWDAKDNMYKMLEINPRYNLWELVGAFAGVNLVDIAYRHQRGESVTPQSHYRDDVRFLYFKQDVRAYWEGYRKNGEWSLTSFLRSYLHNKYFRVFEWRDPLPFVRSVLGFSKRNLGRLVERVVSVGKKGAALIPHPGKV